MVVSPAWQDVRMLRAPGVLGMLGFLMLGLVMLGFLTLAWPGDAWLPNAWLPNPRRNLTAVF